MEERTAMKVHRTMTRWSQTAEALTEWLLYLHLGIGFGAAFAMGASFRLDVGWCAAIGAGVFLILTVGLFHRYTVWICTVLGTLVIAAVAALVAVLFGVSFLVTTLGAEVATAICATAGGLVGVLVGVVSYRPFLRRLREKRA